LNNTIILKDKEKNKKLIFSIITKYFLESKKGFLLLLVVRDKISIDYKKKLSIWGSLDIKRDIDITWLYTEPDTLPHLATL
jgi:hypothetical protein